MFQASFIERGRNLRAAALAWPLSVVLHAGAVFLLIIVPLLQHPKLPPLHIRPVVLVPPPAPPVLPAAGRKRPSGRGSRIHPVTVRTGSGARSLVAPFVIPDTISPEAIVDPGSWSDLIGANDGPDGVPIDETIGRIIATIAGKEEKPMLQVGALRPPRLVKRVEPVYPEVARQARVFGTVKLEATTDVLGRVREAHVILSIPLLDEAALDAVRQWIYEPLVVNGRPRAMTFTVIVRFVLN